jgi:hypothetical protein
VDLTLVLLPSALFGLFVTAHFALVFTLSERPPRFRAVVAFLVPPLAPYWGFREGLRAWSSVWLLSLASYAAALALALRA